VLTNLPSLSFDSGNGVVEVQQQTGEFIVFLSPNERKLTIRASGYLPLDIILSEIGIRLQSGQLWELTVTGEQQVDKIPVNFAISPAGNNLVFSVDGQSQNSYSNVLLALGKHQIRLEKTGFRTIEESIEVSLENSLFTYELKPIDPVVVSFESNPLGVTVAIEGIEIGQTPIQGFYYPGSYAVEWRKSGYLSSEQRIEVIDSGQNSFKAELTKNSGSINWTVQPIGASVAINKVLQSGSSADLAPGLYKVEVTADGYDSYEETIQIEREQRIQKSWNLIQQLGGIQFSITPSTANIELAQDGKVVDSWQGLKFSRDIPVGNYTISAKIQDYKSQEQPLINNKR